MTAFSSPPTNDAESVLLIALLLASLVAMVAAFAYWKRKAAEHLAAIRALTESNAASLGRLSEEIDGLRRYLYEIDPQFDEERRRLHDAKWRDNPTAWREFEAFEAVKAAAGRRTLRTPFRGSARLPPNDDASPPQA